MTSCSNCIYDDEEIGCRVACIRKEYFEPKEKLMTDKPQLFEDKFMFESKNQLRDIMNLILETQNDDHNETIERIIINAGRENLIRKSELETLVEEAEEMANSTGELTSDYCYNIIVKKQAEVIQALKKDHPEFNK